MGIVQEYLKKKKIKELGLPKMYIVKSTPKGVSDIKESQVINIVEGKNKKIYSDIYPEGKVIPYKIYYMEDGFPYEIDMDEDSISDSVEGHGTGFGDLWGWTYYCTLSEDDAKEYHKNETERVSKKYF